MDDRRYLNGYGSATFRARATGIQDFAPYGRPIMCKWVYAEPAHWMSAPVGLCALGSPVVFGSKWPHDPPVGIYFDGHARCVMGIRIAALHARQGQHRTGSHLLLNIIRTNSAGRHTIEAKSHCRVAIFDQRKAKRVARKETEKLSARVPKQQRRRNSPGSHLVQNRRMWSCVGAGLTH